MAHGSRRPVTAGIAVGAALALLVAGALCGRVTGGPPAHSTPDRDAVAAAPAEAVQAAPQTAAPVAVHPVAPPDAGGPAAAPPAASLPMPPPRDALDTPEWRSSKVAFRPRELGKLGPYVKAGLDAARRDMDFCFQRSAARADPAPEVADTPEDAAPPSLPDPAILLLYIEAREGALDIVDARTEHLGTSSPELVECCREVLRGTEIKAFDTVPGRRYRVKFRLH